MGDRSYSYDANNGLADGAAPMVAAGYAQFAGADGIVDLGGNQGVTVTLPGISAVGTITPQQARIDAVCVVDVSALTLAGVDIYNFLVLGSNDPSFGAGNVYALGAMSIGMGAAMAFPNGGNTAAVPAVGGNRFEILFTNEQNNVKYQYVKLYITGTFGSVTFKSFIAVLPRE